MNVRMLILALGAVLAIAGCGDDGDSSTEAETTGASATEAAERSKPKVEVPEGSPPKDLEIEDLIDGTGRSARTRRWSS